MILTIEAFDLLWVTLDFPLERPQNYDLPVFSLLGDDHVTVFSLLGDVIHQQAENKQILVLRPF